MEERVFVRSIVVPSEIDAGKRLTVRIVRGIRGTKWWNIPWTTLQNRVSSPMYHTMLTPGSYM